MTSLKHRSSADYFHHAVLTTIALSILLCLGGCFKKIQVEDQLPPGFVFQPYSTVSDLSAYATLKIKEEKRTDSVTLLVFAKYPNRVRMEVYQILGQTLFTLVIH